MNIKEEIEKQLGPAPDAPPDLRLLGWSLNPDAQSKYNTDISNYRAASAVILNRLLNPVSYGQAENILGPERAKGLATDENYRPGAPQTVPSMVPSFQAPPIQPGPPLGMGLNPPTPAYGPGAPMPIAPPPNATYPPNQYPAMNALLTPDYNKRTSTYFQEGPRPTASTEGPTYGPPPGAIAPPSIRPMFPNPSLEFTPQPGPSQTISPLELNRESPVNPQTRDLVESFTKRFASPYFDYKRGGHSPLDTYNQKKDDIRHSLTFDHPDWSPDQLEAETDAIASGRKNIESLTGQRKANIEQGQERINQGQQKIDLTREQLNEKKREFDTKMQQLKDLEKRGADPATIRLMQLEELKNYHKHLYTYVTLKNQRGELSDEAAQKMLEDFIPEEFGLTYQPQKGVVQEAIPGLFSPKLGPSVSPANPGGPVSITPNPSRPPSQLTLPNQGVSSTEIDALKREMEAKGGAKQYEGKLLEYNGKKYRIRNGIPTLEGQ